MLSRGFTLLLGCSCPLIMTILLLAALPAWGEADVVKATERTGTVAARKTEDLEMIDGAIAKARGVIAAEPANAAAYSRLAYLLIRKGALDEAMNAFDEALRLNPRLYDAKTGRGIVLARKGNLREAELVLKDALVLNPNPVRTHYELGLLYEQLNDFEKAVAEFKEGIRKHEQGRL